MRKHTLFVTDHNPSGIGGGAYATRAFINAFSVEEKNELVILGAASIDPTIFSHNNRIRLIKVEPRSTFQKVTGLLSLQLHRLRYAFVNYLSLNHMKIDKIIFDGSIVAGDLINIAQKYKIPAITIHHNVDGKYFKDSKSMFTLWGITSCLIDYRQRNAFSKSYVNLTLSENDKTELEKKFELDGRSSCYNIGCFEYERKPNKEKENRTSHNSCSLSVVITGTLIAKQTEDGVTWFIDNFLPILKRYENISITIAGRDPSKKLQMLCRKHDIITLVANPANMNNIIKEADIYICPIRLGSGLKLRVMDGLRNGIPVIAHKTSASGYEAHFNKPWFKIFTGKDDFEREFHNLYTSLMQKEFTKVEIEKHFYRDFSFEAGINRLKQVLARSAKY